jgi:hypothetical protein
LNEPTDYDGAWKETLERFLPQFLELAFPAIHRAVDWTKTVRFLDTELQEIVRAAEAGTVRADKLVEVTRVDGVEEWLLIHAEVQRLMNWLLALPVEEEVIFREAWGRLQKETSMRYISTYDRLVRAEALEEGLLLGLQKGRLEGRLEGRQEGRLTLLRETIAETLRERFGVVSESAHSRLEAVADEGVLRRLAKRVWAVGSVAEFEAEL